jgi:hypothetical protein
VQDLTFFVDELRIVIQVVGLELSNKSSECAWGAVVVLRCRDFDSSIHLLNLVPLLVVLLL